VRVDPPASTIYVGGQNGVGADGAIVEGGLGAQSARAFANLETVLAEAGASSTS
jgi:2-iminobutanoate/2-iminopropanoate deaminase